MNAVKAMRGCILVEHAGQLLPFATRLLRGLLGRRSGHLQGRGAGEICRRVGVDAQRFFAGIAQQPIKDELQANTDEVIARGGFGSPTMFVDRTDMYFGNDRLPLLREAVERKLGLRK